MNPVSAGRNLHPEFVGVEQIILEHQRGLEKFRMWAETHSWNEFHRNHYDWWMFPYDQPSQYGFAYTVYETEVSDLLAIEGFKERHAEGARLLLLSWGWDDEAKRLVEQPDIGQSWSSWPIRLFKCAKSLEQFGQHEIHESCLIYASHLKSIGYSFEYNFNRDLAMELGI